jgi:hypothetical protein
MDLVARKWAAEQFDGAEFYNDIGWMSNREMFLFVSSE